MDKLRTPTLSVAVAGGLISVCLMLLSSLRPPILLLILFALWVLAPFAALAFGVLISPRLTVVVRQTVYAATYFIAAGSLAVYGFVLARPVAGQPAFPYVAVPLGSWLLIAIAVTIATLRTRRPAARADTAASSRSTDSATPSLPVHAPLKEEPQTEAERVSFDQ